MEGDMIRVDELLHLYSLKDSKEFGYYELVLWDRKSCLIASLPSSFCYWKSRYFFVLRDGWETLSNDLWGDIPRLLRRWGTPRLGASSFISASCFFFRYLTLARLTLMPRIRLLLAAKTHPKLKSRYKSCVKSATEYAGTIDDFDELIDPKTLAHHFLGPEPSPYVLRSIAREVKSKYSSFSALVFLLLVLLLLSCLRWSFAKMATKFNQELYAKLREKKNCMLVTRNGSWSWVPSKNIWTPGCQIVCHYLIWSLSVCRTCK